MLTEFHIGIDDTDSVKGGCTTYVAALIFQKLCDRSLIPSDFPWLVRLNPNIPWKTRGNGAVAIHLKIDSANIDEVVRISLDTVENSTDLSEQNADPAVVFLKGPVPDTLREFYDRALQEVLSVNDARTIAEIVGADAHLIKGVKGIVGSLAALGAGLDEEAHTFEIIAYRSKAQLGTPRQVDSRSVTQMDSEFQGETFQNRDPETDRILICPHGPDPVLLGIRGERPEVLWNALKRVKTGEPLERVMIFRTNQGTDAHIRHQRSVSSLRPYQAVTISGRVETIPRVLRGGHVVFSVRDETGSVDCVAFARSGSMMKITRELLQGDLVQISGGVRRRSDRLSINLEKIEIVKLVETFRLENPKCPVCGKRSESMGKNQGLRCKNCRFRLGHSIKDRTVIRRKLEESVYIPPPRSRRHLTNPDPARKLGNAETTEADLIVFESLLKAAESASFA